MSNFEWKNASACELEWERDTERDIECKVCETERERERFVADKCVSM